MAVVMMVIHPLDLDQAAQKEAGVQVVLVASPLEKNLKTLGQIVSR
ncbi:MAG TPA: hypothetical protein VEY51_18575 [Chondromyces sp.]|nr:hypothetical protein [Chondromyces sp.]